MKRKKLAAGVSANGKRRIGNTALAAYFTLGMFAFFTCGNYFGVISVSLLGSGEEHLTYGMGCLAGTLGVALSCLFGLLLRRRETFAETVLYICFPLAALLVVAAAFAKSPASFYGVLLPFYVLEGFNVGLCVRFICKVNVYDGAGKLLGSSSCAGLIACYALNFSFPFDSSLMIPVHAVCLAAAILLMQYVAVRKLDVADLMEYRDTHKTDNEAQRRYLYVLCAVCGAIAMMSFMIGINDVAIYSALLADALPSKFLPQLLYLPGLFLAGLLADVRCGKYLPMATLGCVLLSAPVITFLNKPELFAAYSWITYFTGGFFLMYIMMSMTAIVHRSRRPALEAPLTGFLFFLFSGVGAFSSVVFINADVFVTLSAYAVLAMCLLFVLYLSGGLRAVSLAGPEPEAYAQNKTLAELVADYGFTAREAEALHLLLADKNTSEIAEAMSVVEGTVYKYISAMIAKTGSKTRIDLIAKFSGINLDFPDIQ